MGRNSHRELVMGQAQCQHKVNQRILLYICMVMVSVNGIEKDKWTGGQVRQVIRR